MSRPEIYPFTKMSWRSRQIEEKWEPIRERVNQACYFAEYESVRRGYRNCDVYDLNPNNFDNQIKKVMLDGLVYLPILRSKTYGGYGHRHYVANTIDENTFIYGVVARNLNDAIRFHDAGVTDLTKRIKDDPAINPHGIDHEVTGTLLGYPECDRRFFNCSTVEALPLCSMHMIPMEMLFSRSLTMVFCSFVLYWLVASSSNGFGPR